MIKVLPLPPSAKMYAENRLSRIDVVKKGETRTRRSKI